MRIYHANGVAIPLPPDHRFPAIKYDLLLGLVRAAGLVDASRIVEAAPVTAAEVELAHDPGYVRAVLDGTLPESEWRRVGLPWSPELIERTLRSVGATLAACNDALAGETAVNLGGGTHHAGPARGGGYCVFNDMAVALRVLLQGQRIRRALVVDTDVHQGDGTAAIFADDARVFTLSLHGARNYPAVKVASDLDVALPDGTGDDAYLGALGPALEEALARSAPGLAIFLAGADAWEGDRLGRLALTRAGLAARDRLVLSRLRDAGVPVAIVMGGGYAPDPADTARIHLETVRVATFG